MLCHNGWWLLPTCSLFRHWSVIVLLSCWLVTVSSAVLTCSLVRQWRYRAFVVLVGDYFFSSVDLFFVQTVEILCFCHNGWWLFPQQHWLVLCSDGGDIVLLSYWLVTVSSTALTGSLFRQWSYCAFVVLVDDCFLSSVDLFFQTMEELQKTEILKKGQELGKELGKTAGKAAETISKSGEQISQTAAYKTVSEVRVSFFFHGTATRQICVTHWKITAIKIDSVLLQVQIISKNAPLL